MKAGRSLGAKAFPRVMGPGLAGSLLILAATVLPASGDTWDFETDFSTNNNPNDVWSCRWQSGGTTRDGNYALMPNRLPTEVTRAR